MIRLLGVGAMLLTVASTGVAGEHYVEIWNPPEAQLMHPPVGGKPRSDKTTAHSHHPSKAIPRRVADPVAKTSPSARAGANLKKPVTPRPMDIPRIVTPEGNVLRVSDRNTSVLVIR